MNKLSSRLHKTEERISEEDDRSHLSKMPWKESKTWVC